MGGQTDGWKDDMNIHSENKKNKKETQVQDELFPLSIGIGGVNNYVLTRATEVHY